jgi:D-3-phosphoglycerate dehydrogenase
LNNKINLLSFKSFEFSRKTIKEPTKFTELINHPNLICTPHLGASTTEAQNRVAVDIAEQIVKFAKHNQLEGAVIFIFN